MLLQATQSILWQCDETASGEILISTSSNYSARQPSEKSKRKHLVEQDPCPETQTSVVVRSRGCGGEIKGPRLFSNAMQITFSSNNQSKVCQTISITVTRAFPIEPETRHATQQPPRKLFVFGFYSQTNRCAFLIASAASSSSLKSDTEVPPSPHSQQSRANEEGCAREEDLVLLQRTEIKTLRRVTKC